MLSVPGLSVTETTDDVVGVVVEEVPPHEAARNVRTNSRRCLNTGPPRSKGRYDLSPWKRIKLGNGLMLSPAGVSFPAHPDATEPCVPMPAEPSPPETVTQLLEDARSGDRQALDRLLPLVYAELHRIAESHMRAERPDHTPQDRKSV